MRMSNALELHGISKRFVVGAASCRGSVDALRSIDFCVEPGEAVAVVGSAGAGKSTLLLIAAGLLRADAGEIAWFGRSDRTLAAERSTYYFAGVSSKGRRQRSSAAPHIHLVDGPDTLGVTDASRLEKWIVQRCAIGDSVLISLRSGDIARSIAVRQLVLRAGRVIGDRASSAVSRVAEPIEWGHR